MKFAFIQLTSCILFQLKSQAWKTEQNLEKYTSCAIRKYGRINGNMTLQDTRKCANLFFRWCAEMLETPNYKTPVVIS
jgi:hypothetical protein